MDTYGQIQQKLNDVSNALRALETVIDLEVAWQGVRDKIDNKLAELDVLYSAFKEEQNNQGE